MRCHAFTAAIILAAAPSFAQETEIQDVITSQLDAFRADDFAAAFTYASPMIQGMFRTPENFGMMVQNGYPMVHRSDDVNYLGIKVEGQIMRQRVVIRDASGAFHALDYDMIQGPDGWKINGVRIVDLPDIGV